MIFGAAAIWFIRTIQANLDIRQRQLSDLAARLGLDFAATAPFDLATLPFELFQVSGGTTFTNVLYGTLGGLSVTAFDHRHLTTVGSQKVSAFSCVLTSIDADAPAMIVERQAASAYRLGATVGGAARVTTESVEFDRAFHIRCDDRRFALAILDPALMGWLLETDGDWSFELSGTHLLCYARQRRPGAVEGLLDALTALRHRLDVGNAARLVATTTTQSPVLAPYRRPIRAETATTLTLLGVVLAAGALFAALVAYLALTGRIFIDALP